MNEDRPRVVIADAQPTARASAAKALERGGLAIAGQAATADEAIEMVVDEAPDACLIDVMLPGGVRAIAEIVDARPATAVVVLTETRERDPFLDAVRAGAVGYLLKDMDPGRLSHAIKGVLAGEAAIPRDLVASLVSELSSQGRRRLVIGRNGRAELTAREWEVADLMAAGLRTTQIAERLMVSPVTVRRHISGVMEKLGARDRADAIELLAVPGGSR